MLNSRLAWIFALAAIPALPAAAQRPQSSRDKTRAVSAPVPRTVRARITLDNGKLTVDARNSSLNQILEEIARLTGVSIAGVACGKLIFGLYGPGDPGSVITSLLQSSGYNFLLVGGPDLPRQLLLIPKTLPSSPSSSPSPSVQAQPTPQPPDLYSQQYAELESGNPY